eukprot:GHVU01231898.1.p1 GENE.GHVU01231898.1~~GHVU01231898.1.p1  ORF type:complete len:121 (+),score=17.04 GHVU01231898.1:43-363(+)
MAQEGPNFMDAGQPAAARAVTVETASSRGEMILDTPAGLVRSADSLRRDEEIREKIRNAAVDASPGNWLTTESKELYGQMRELPPQYGEALSASASGSRDRGDAGP